MPRSGEIIDLTGGEPRVRGPGNVQLPDGGIGKLLKAYAREFYHEEFTGIRNGFLTFRGSRRRLREIQADFDNILRVLERSSTMTEIAEIASLRDRSFDYFVRIHVLPGLQDEHYMVSIDRQTGEIRVTWDPLKMESLSFGKKPLAEAMDAIAEFASNWTCEVFNVDDSVAMFLQRILDEDHLVWVDDSIFVMHDKPDFAKWVYSNYGEEHSFTETLVPFGYTEGCPLFMASIANWFAKMRKEQDKLAPHRFWYAEVEYDDPDGWKTAPNWREVLHSTPFRFTLHIKVLTGNPTRALEDAMFFLGEKIGELRNLHETRRQINELPSDDEEEEEEEDLDARTEAINAGRICGVCHETDVELSTMCGKCSCLLCDLCRENPHVQSADRCFGCQRDRADWKQDEM
jgi:hypothetical protein